MKNAITFKQKSNFSKTIKHLNRIKGVVTIDMFEKYGKQGVAALASATPVDSGKTANSWSYKVMGLEMEAGYRGEIISILLFSLFLIK